MIYFNEAIAFSHRNGREENQDACGYLISRNQFPDSSVNGAVYFVADGVSNSNGSEAAARIKKGYRKVLAKLLMECITFQEETQAMQLSKETVAWELCEKLRDAVQALDKIVAGDRSRDVGATISLALVLGCHVYTANLGDSPIYLMELDDDDMPMELIPLYQCHNGAADLPEEEALRSDGKYVLTVPVLGDAPKREDIAVCSNGLYQNNLLLLGSDGALAALTKASIKDLIGDCMNAAESEEANKLDKINSALFDAIKAAGEEDNYTLVGQMIRTD